LVDTLVFVVQPGAGDTLQFMKAGILEWPDVFVVNKADLGSAASRTRSELIAGLGLGERRDDPWTPPVLLCSARDDTGMDELFEAIEAHRAAQLESGRARLRRRQARASHVVDALLRRWGTAGIERIGGQRALEARIDREHDASPFRLAERIGRELADLSGDARDERQAP
jgi:LAO/AO transport system kinase